MTCLPDALWTDPRCLYLKRRRRRLFLLLCDMERLRAAWHPDDVATWIDGIWAANLDVREGQFAKDLAELRALGLLEEEAIRLTFCRPTPEGFESLTERAPRRRYPSDDRRSSRPTLSQTDSADPPQQPIAESAAAPHGADTSSASDSADTPPHARGIDDRMDRSDRSDSYIKIDSDLIDLIEKPLTPEAAADALVRTALISRRDARVYVERYGAARVMDVAHSLPYWKPQKPAALARRALEGGQEKYPRAPALDSRQQAMNLPVVVSGGQSEDKRATEPHFSPPPDARQGHPRLPIPIPPGALDEAKRALGKLPPTGTDGSG